GDFDGEPETVKSIAITPDGKLAVSGGEEGLLRVWDIATRKLVTSVKMAGQIVDVTVSRSGARILTLTQTEGTCRWAVARLKRYACSPPRPRMDHLPSAHGRVRFSPSEDEAFWSSDNGYLRWKLP